MNDINEIVTVVERLQTAVALYSIFIREYFRFIKKMLLGENWLTILLLYC